MTHLFSATQISTYEMCPRKWAWSKIDGISGPTSPYAEMGVRVHENLEEWFLSRKVPEGDLAATVANAMIPHLPPPQAIDPANIEREFRWTFDDVAFRGFIDLVHVNDGVTIYDHKTTSDLQWAKSADDLIEDVQATLYARVMMDTFNVPNVTLQWTYATRKPRPVVRPVRVAATRDNILPRVSLTVASAREMQTILDSGCTAAEVPYDASACDAFGGCPFRGNCNLNEQQRIQSIMSQENSKQSFLQRLQARKAGTAPAATAPSAINPPEASIEVPAPAPVQAAEPIAAEESKRKPVARAKKADVAAPVAAPVAVSATQNTNDFAHVAAVAAVTGWTLYLDCQPVKGGAAEHISDRIARVMAEYTAETGQSHYKLAEYGKGPALFAEGFAKDLAANPPATGIIAASASQEVRDVLQVLMASAATIIQG